ncbi:DUF1289 domain-containing protein [Euryhalocaulis sp.]|uniref:DUF1289 domain-containing protein n=1 Tax=Euryhalocaulis sp. TaxID=2744307 RepID=UPI0025799C2C|nr:DUF1289 domain-containing protein [Euryhalocaulis sp.]
MKAPPASSPCINVCFVDPKLRHCVGCWRSLEEIGRWSKMTEDERQAVMDGLESRAKRLEAEFYAMREDT